MKNKIWLLLILVGSFLTVTEGTCLAAVQTVSGAGNRAIDADGIDDGVSMTGQGALESTLTVSDGEDVNDDQENAAAIVTDVTNKGNATFDGSSTIYGTVGASGARLNTISAGASGSSVEFTAAVFAKDFSVSQDGDVTFSADADITNGVNFAGDGTLTLANGADLTGIVSNTVDGEGTLSITSGSSASGGAIGTAGTHDLLGLQVGQEGIFTLGHDAAASTITIYHAGTMILSGDRTLTGNVVLNDTNLGGVGSAGILTVGANTLNITGAYSMASGTTLNLTANSASSAGSVVATGATTVNAASAINVTVGGYIPGGTALTVISGAGAGATSPTITDSSATLSFTASTVNGDTTLTATRNSVATTGNAAAVGNVLGGFGSSVSSDMSRVLGALDSLGTADEVGEALDQLDPVANGGATASSFLSGTLHQEAISGHLADLRTSPSAGQTGISSGDAWYQQGVWLKGYGAHAVQDPRSGINGYKSDLWGVAGGVDRTVAEGKRLGFAGGYAPTAVESQGDSGTTDIQSYQATVYTGITQDSGYFNAAFTFGWHSYKGTRTIGFGSINRAAESNYDGQQYTIYFEAGRPLDLGRWELTPLMSVEYSHLNIDGYTETGAGDLNLHVSGQSYDLFQTGLGAKLAYPIVTPNGRWVPEVHARWLYDVIGDEFQASSTLTGGGASFTTQGIEPAQHALNAGAGLVIFLKDGVTLSGTYDLILKEDYLSHHAEAVLRYNY